MYEFITILIVLVCIFMMFIVLIQNPKGSGLGAGFGGGSANMMGGVQQTGDFLEKATWWLIGFLFFLSIISNAFLPTQGDGQQGGDTEIEKIIDEGE